VDDKHENVDAAASHGLAGHVFRSTASLKLALRQAGLRLV
jgi:hypothetical protein